MSNQHKIIDIQLLCRQLYGTKNQYCKEVIDTLDSIYSIIPVVHHALDVEGTLEDVAVWRSVVVPLVRRW